MLEDFMRALARVHSDYGFYIGCQANPTLALEGYTLSLAERLALTSPKKLGEVLGRSDGMMLPRITITISGKHDWVNRALPEGTAFEKADHHTAIALEVDAIKRATTDAERREASVRLMGLIG